jgi:hypothetical protein
MVLCYKGCTHTEGVIVLHAPEWKYHSASTTVPAAALAHQTLRFGATTAFACPSTASRNGPASFTNAALATKGVKRGGNCCNTSSLTFLTVDFICCIYIWWWPWLYRRWRICQLLEEGRCEYLKRGVLVSWSFRLRFMNRRKEMSLKQIKPKKKNK